MSAEDNTVRFSAPQSVCSFKSWTDVTVVEVTHMNCHVGDIVGRRHKSRRKDQKRYMYVPFSTFEESEVGIYNYSRLSDIKAAVSVELECRDLYLRDM